MAETSPKHGLTRGNRGWYKRVAGDVRWVCSDRAAPTGDDADAIFEERFRELNQPAKSSSDMTVEEMFEQIVARRLESVQNKRLSMRTVRDYADAGARFVEVVGNVHASRTLPRHFSAFARAIERYSPHRQSKLAILVKTTFRWAANSGFIPDVPDFGPDLRGASKAEFRRHKAKRGPMLYSRDEVKKLLEHSAGQLKAMILLALNGGLGNTDLSDIPKTAIDKNAGVLRFARGKTGIERVIPLWPDFLEAIKSAKVPGERLFLHPSGRPWVSEDKSNHDLLAVAFGELCIRAGVVNRGFYTLRRTHRTHADEVGDQRAAAAIMGHDTGDVGGIYVQRISLERLKAITDHVRASVLGDSPPSRGSDRTSKKRASGRGGRGSGRKNKPAKPRG